MAPKRSFALASWARKALVGMRTLVPLRQRRPNRSTSGSAFTTLSFSSTRLMNADTASGSCWRVDAAHGGRQQRNAEAGKGRFAQRQSRVAAEARDDLHLLNTVGAGQAPGCSAIGVGGGHAVVGRHVPQRARRAARGDVSGACHHAVAERTEELAADIARVGQWTAAKRHVDPIGDQIGVGIVEHKASGSAPVSSVRAIAAPPASMRHRHGPLRGRGPLDFAFTEVGISGWHGGHLRWPTPAVAARSSAPRRWPASAPGRGIPGSPSPGETSGFAP